MSQESQDPRLFRVWDLPTRMFHWILVVLVTVAMATGFILPQALMGLHVFAGVGIAALLVFRVIWAFQGGTYSRLVALLPTPRSLREYIRGLSMLRPPHHIGHNPLGAIMVLALFAVLVALAVSGFVVMGGEEKWGPLGHVISYATGTVAKSIHGWLSALLLVMIAAHVSGVTASSWLFGEGLIRSMIVGTKRFSSGEPSPVMRKSHPYQALFDFVLFSACIMVGAFALESLPDRGWHPVATLPEYQTSCGGCHAALHPSLLPRATWMAVMAKLDDHFGEDASLANPDTRLKIEQYLNNHSSETFDTEASIRFRERPPNEPLRITSTPYWQRKHAKIDAQIFRQRAVGGRANCIACHTDAETGRFDDYAIAVPTE